MESNQGTATGDQLAGPTQQQRQADHTAVTEAHRPLRYIAYLRVSTKKQGAEGLGIEAQRSIIKQYVKGDIIAEFVEVESGSSRTRPQLLKAVELSNKEKAILITAKLDRLARDTEFAMMVKNKAYDLVCCDIPGMNLFMFGIMALFAEYERNRIRGRIIDAKRVQKERDGKKPMPEKTRKALAKAKGWEKGGEARKKAAQQYDYSTLRTIKDLRQKGMKLEAIASTLNEHGQMQPSGNPWHHVAIHRVLTAQVR